MRCNLDRWGVVLESLLCPCCEQEMEDVNYLFLKCSLAHQHWLKVALWVEQPIPMFSSLLELMQWIDGLRSVCFHRMIMESVCVTLFGSFGRIRMH